MFYYKPELKGKITPDSMKDAVLGENYANKGTDAAWFVNFVAKYGLKLYKLTGNPITLSHQLIQEGKPAIFTEIDPYVNTSLPQYEGWTHVGSFYKEIAGGLDAMDPFGGKLVSKSDADWSKVLVGNEIWTVERIQTMNIPQGWKDDGQTLVSPNGVPVVHGFRLHVLNNNWPPANWPLAAEYGTDQVEGSNQALGGGTEQIFRSSVLEWTKDRGVFEMWTGQELDYTRKQVAKYYNLAVSAQAQVAQLQAQIAQLQQTNPDALNAIHQAQAILRPF